MSASPTGKTEPTFANEAPRRKSSKIARKEDPTRSPDAPDSAEPPKRTKSMLERLGIANADFIGPGDRPFEEGELPKRSPEGTIRAHGGSKLVRRNVSKVGKDAVEKENAKDEVAPTGPQWHLMPLEEFFTTLSTRAGGLTTAEALAALQKHGKNEITPPPKQSVFVKFIKNVISPFSAIMIICGVLSFAIVGYNSGTSGIVDKQNIALGAVLIAVAVIVSIFQTAMENSADNLMDALHSLTAESAWVLRDGQLVQIAAAQLVPGDVVRVQLGEKVPADLRIIEAAELKVNNAPLTGETVDIRLGPDANDHRLFEAKNIARSGCNFTSGNGLGVLFATGDNTFFGTIAKAATTAEKPDTLMRREVKRLILMMASIGIVMSVAFFIATMVLYKSLIKAFIIVVGLFTANVPEGLLPQITVALTITARRMFERKVIVANLEIIETLGAVSVICSDKTGTLTLNRMTVSHMVLDGQIVMNQFSPILQGDNVIMLDPKSTTYQAVQRVICLNSDAMFIQREPANDPFAWEVKGDASETALVKFAQSNIDVDKVRAEHKRLAVVPFSSKKKWMAAVAQLGPNRQLVMLKGAAERVISRCKSMLTAEGEVPLNDARRAELDAILLNLARRAERVFAFAHLEINMPDDFEFVVDGDMTNFPLENLTLCGMASMIDPPRPSVPGAIKACHKAGIHVIMVTGDHPETAVAISRGLGLITLPLLSEAGPNANPDKCAIVVTGDDLARMHAMEPNKKEAEWDRVLACREHVFARTQPEQKQDLVRALQSRGQVVAMTGDGVNDSPALKAANVGVAVGSGTSVAKEAAQIIILDDDFGSIVVGVREGRMIFDNLKKAITYIVAHLTPELLPFVLNFAIKIPLAMETITILLVDLGTDMLPGIALAYEEAEDRIMSVPPRTADDHMVQPRMLVLGYGYTGLLESFFAFWSYYWVWYAHGYNFNSIRGIEQGYHDPWERVDSDMRDEFRSFCARSRDWHGGCTTDADMTAFMPWLNTLVGKSCAAYFITMAIMQWAHVLTRRNQTMSMFDPRQSLNWRLFAAIAFSVAFACFFVYVPQVNAAFYLAAVDSGHAIAGMWGVGVLIGIDELRKYFCRRWPKGLIAKYTLY